MKPEIGESRSTEKRDYWGLIIFFLVSDFFLYGLFHNKLAIPTDVDWAYSKAAFNLLSGNGLTVEGQLHTHHPPLFPLFLAGIYFISGVWNTDNAVYPILIIVLQAFSCGWIYLVARQWFGPRVGLWSALLYSFYPLFMILTATKYIWNNTSLFIYLFLGFFYFFIRAVNETHFLRQIQSMVIGGMMLGLASLTWAGSIHLWVLAAGAFMFVSKSSKRFFVLCAFMLSVLSPPCSWAVYTYHKTGSAVWGSSASFKGVIDGMFHTDGSKLRRFSFAKKAFNEAEQGRLTTTRDAILFYKNELIHNPSETIPFVLYKIARPWYATDSENFEKITAAIQLIYIPLAIIGWIAAMKRQRFAALWSLCVIGYFWAISFVVLSIVRYMVPVMGIVMIFAAFAIEQLYVKIKAK